MKFTNNKYSIKGLGIYIGLIIFLSAVVFLLFSNMFERSAPQIKVQNEIYWNFQNINSPQGYEIGRIFARVSGYDLTDVPYNSSFAGYKDWFLQNYRRPSYTVEAGIGESPLPLSQFNQIYNDNIGILIIGAAV